MCLRLMLSMITFMPRGICFWTLFECSSHCESISVKRLFMYRILSEKNKIKKIRKYPINLRSQIQCNLHKKLGILQNQIVTNKK